MSAWWDLCDKLNLGESAHVRYLFETLEKIVRASHNVSAGSLHEQTLFLTMPRIVPQEDRVRHAFLRSDGDDNIGKTDVNITEGMHCCNLN